MMKITILALVLAAIALSGVVSVASAETVPSPLQQVQDGVPTGEVMCSENRVLMMSQIGMPACVFEESVLKLETRGFEFVGEPFDMFPIKSSDSQQSYVSTFQIGPRPVVSMSNLPNIGETAVVEITYTSKLPYNVTDSDDLPTHNIYQLGWMVTSGFEIVDSGGVEPWTIYAGKDEPSALTYQEFVPLDSGETKTYRIVVKAINEDVSYVLGVGYYSETARIALYLDDEETLPLLEHIKKYPEMYQRSVRAEPQPDLPPTKAERDALMAATPPYVPPTREKVLEWFADFFGDKNPNPEVGWALDLVLNLGKSVNINITDARQILSDIGYSDGEIDDAVSGTVSVASAKTVPSPLQQVRNGVPADEVVCSYGRILVTPPSGAPACVFAGSVEVLERRGFVLPSEMPLDDLLPKRPKASEKAGITSSPDASKTDDRPFVTTWRTASPNESITIPAGSSTGAYTVDWGDGTATSVTGDASHAYASPGEYRVVISGDFTRIYLNGGPNAEKLQSIDQWGDIQWESMNSAFGGATNMVYRATDVPDLSGVTDMSAMFGSATSFNGDISPWDVSSVTAMSAMFADADSFNGDVSSWDVSGVTDMSGMFGSATSFSGDISGWDVSRVTDMVDMFHSASSFNGDISGWDVSSTTRMNNMFYRADSFDQNMGPWYIVLDDAVIDRGSVPGDVGRITAQNAFLDSQNPAYGIGSGGDSDYFEIDGSILKMKSVPDGHAGPYSVTITSAGTYGSENSRTFEISVTDGDGNTSSATPSDPRSVGEIILSSTLPGTIQIDWDAPGEEPREYRITWAKSGEEFPDWRDPVGNAFPTGSSYTITGLDEDEEYQVKVRARYDSGGPGPWGDISAITVAGSG